MPVICVMESKSTCPIVKLKSHIDFIPAILVAVVIAIASLWENPQMPKAIAISDLLIHGVMYCVLAATMMVPVSKRCPARTMPYVYVCVSAVAYGVLMEALQRFCTLTRTGCMDDVYANLAGAIIGVLIIAIWRKIPYMK